MTHIFSTNLAIGGVFYILLAVLLAFWADKFNSRVILYRSEELAFAGALLIMVVYPVAFGIERFV